ncbi:hypothetical protein FBQ96_16270 [Nitrospirales bacterium NOB]|nr:hypothetical protein [Nitrospirota bacterium]MCE7967089.1 hypothetical protein [Nitrospira sp. NTP2]MCK6491899.1 hypothetical protein [Nitrospira sp.]MDL1891097.1 hypothetical protein [Nitrospirales bacterium NOB]MEB2340021.1 hypothetical protein [Nitrospirales bacterium]
MELRNPETPNPFRSLEPDRQKHSLEIRLGSNIFRNTNGVLRIQGKEQLVLELNPEHGRILLTIDLYDGSGNHVAHLRRNRWAFNDGNRFALSTSDSPPTLFPNLAWLKVTDQETGETVLETAVAPGEKIQVATGKFYSHRGQLVEITSHYCRIGSTQTLFGDVFEARGGTAVLG